MMNNLKNYFFEKNYSNHQYSGIIVLFPNDFIYVANGNFFKLHDHSQILFRLVKLIIKQG